MPEKIRQYFKDFIFYIIGYVAPERRDAMLVRSIDEKSANSLAEAPPVENMSWIKALWWYKDPKVKAIIWELKYRENTAPLLYAGKYMYEEIVALVSDIILFDQNARFLLIPIPISIERRIERGYNQSEHIAKSILSYDKTHLLTYAPQWLEKTKETSIQSKSASKSERMHNLDGCFRANQKVAGSYVILIDDVVTTGSTLSEAQKKLLSVGAREVFAFTIAH